MSQPFILLISDDLFFGSRISGAAQQCAVKLIVDGAASLERLGEDACVGVLLDMEHKTASLSDIVSGASDGCQLIAYGPHVHTHLFDAATAAGFQTISRGQLDRDTVNVVKSLLPAE